MLTTGELEAAAEAAWDAYQMHGPQMPFERLAEWERSRWRRVCRTIEKAVEKAAGGEEKPCEPG